MLGRAREQEEEDEVDEWIRGTFLEYGKDAWWMEGVQRTLGWDRLVGGAEMQGCSPAKSVLFPEDEENGERRSRRPWRRGMCVGS